MVNWAQFVPADFEYDFRHDELAAHGVAFEEAVECFFGDYEIRRNKTYQDVTNCSVAPSVGVT